MTRGIQTARSTLTALLLLSITSNGNGQSVQSQVPDNIAFLALYHVFHDAPPPHWDRETCIGWLRERGVEYRAAERIIQAATQYMQKHAQIEAELRQLNQLSANSLDSKTQQQLQALETRRSQEMAAVNDRLRADLGPERSGQLSLVVEDVKKNIRMKTEAAK
jgi:hypothetical protein